MLVGFVWLGCVVGLCGWGLRRFPIEKLSENYRGNIGKIYGKYRGNI